MNYFLIDLENVQDSGFDGLKEYYNLLKNEKNKLYIFYSDHCPRIGIDLLVNGLGNLDVEYVKGVNLRKNGLDFNIVYRIGQLAERERFKEVICDHGKSAFYIVSKDRGYESIINLFKNDYPEYNLDIIQNIGVAFDENFGAEEKVEEVEKINTLQNVIQIKPSPNVTVNLKKSKSKAVNSFRSKTLNKIKETTISEKDALIKILNTSVDCGDFHNKLFNEYGEKGRTYYREIKKQVV